LKRERRQKEKVSIQREIERAIQRETEKANILHYISELMREIQERMKELKMCLFIVNELTKDFEMEVSADVRISEAEKGKSLEESTTQKNKANKQKDRTGLQSPGRIRKRMTPKNKIINNKIAWATNFRNTFVITAIPLE